MKKINELTNGEKIVSIFMVQSVDVKMTSSNKPYLQFKLSDNTGEIMAKQWDASDKGKVFASGMLVRVEAAISEYNGTLQAVISNVRPTVDADNVDASDFVKTAPMKVGVMYDDVMDYVARISEPEMKKVVRNLVSAKKEKLMYYPAAKSNHHSVKGGLLYHMLTMLKTADVLGDIYEHINKDLLFAGILLHDLEKVNEMESSELGIVKEYTFEGTMLGHITMGVKNLEREALRIGLDDEIRVLLEHMILSHHYEPQFGSPIKPFIAEAELLHRIDMIDAKMYDYANAVENVNPGEFSDKIWSLDNRPVYRPTFSKE